MILACQMPNDSFITIEGMAKTVNQYRGKVLLLHFWYIYCPPCISEITSFKALDTKYGNKIQIISFSTSVLKTNFYFL